jgi:DNA mismatch repair protein MutS2
MADLKELRLRQKELQLRSDGAKSLKTLLGESRKTLENLVREVKEGELTRDKTLKVKEFLSSLEAAVLAENEELEREGEALAEERSRLEETRTITQKPNREIRLEPGVEVLAGESRRRGRILRLDRKSQGSGSASWIVEIGALKMSFSEKELLPIDSGNESRSSRPSWAADLAPSAPLHLELSLLGMRLPDALEALNRQIDAAVLGGLREFAVVHGKGDGILSKGVHDFMKRDPRVKDYFFSRPEAGGFGRTDVILK